MPLLTSVSSFDYNPETLTLRISAMPKAGHDEFEDFFTKTMIRVSRNVITEAELDQLHFGFGRNLNLPFHTTTAHVGRKAPAFAKQPDAFIGLNDDGRVLFPRVVFEVGFSQSYTELLDDVHQWLVRSEGRIPLVVLIHIEEHDITAPPDSEDEDQHSDDSEASDVAMYERLRSSCDVDRYVGPLSGFAELYRLGTMGVYRVGARIVSRSSLSHRVTLTSVEYHLVPRHHSPCARGPYPAVDHGPAAAYRRRPCHRL